MWIYTLSIVLITIHRSRKRWRRSIALCRQIRCGRWEFRLCMAIEACRRTKWLDKICIHNIVNTLLHAGKILIVITVLFLHAVTRNALAGKETIYHLLFVFLQSLPFCIQHRQPGVDRFRSPQRFNDGLRLLRNVRVGVHLRAGFSNAVDSAALFKAS